MDDYNLRSLGWYMSRSQVMMTWERLWAGVEKSSAKFRAIGKSKDKGGCQLLVPIVGS
jgi:hypothetical protein